MFSPSWASNNSKCVWTKYVSLRSWNVYAYVCDFQNICSQPNLGGTHSFWLKVVWKMVNARKQKKKSSRLIVRPLYADFDYITRCDSARGRQPAECPEQIHVQINNIFRKCCQKNSPSNRIYNELIHSLLLLHFVSFSTFLIIFFALDSALAKLSTKCFNYVFVSIWYIITTKVCHTFIFRFPGQRQK